MNYKISQRGHAALERNIKCVLLMCFAISFFSHEVTIQKMYQTQLLDLASEEETTRVVKPNDNDFQNTIPKPNANRKTWISRARQAVISLSNSILSFVFVHRFFTRSTSFTPDYLLFPTDFPRININFPIPPEPFESKKCLTRMLDIVSFANGALFSFKTKFINHNEN